MKHIILIGDGMGDFPIPSLQNLTPLAAAKTPNLDRLAAKARLGLVKTIPDGMPSGSDVAIMSLMGFDPRGVLTGRGPLESLALNVPLAKGDTAFRLNLVTMEFADEPVIRNHAAGDIGSEEAAELIAALKEKMPLTNGQSIHQGVSYRNVFVWPGAPPALPSIPPHDHLGQPIGQILDSAEYRPIAELVRASWPILAEHPTNLRRIKNGLPPATSIWLWGQGVSPVVATYEERWGLKGATVSAVDIIKGLALATGLSPIKVDGATGGLDTNYEGKVAAALAALNDNDLVVVHLEAPDETSHQGRLDQKLTAIENFDALIVGPIAASLAHSDWEHRILCACDHYTPVALRTHSNDPVPFFIYDSREADALGSKGTEGVCFCEAEAAKTGLFVEDGRALGRLFFGPEKMAPNAGGEGRKA
jgi:2,3-bisphosphoglycerate-independent phosphoglycerate mutase